MKHLAWIALITLAACGNERSAPEASSSSPPLPVPVPVPDLPPDAGDSPDSGTGTGTVPSLDSVHSVLHLGDSMVGFRRGLTLSLEMRFKKAGAKFYSNSWTSAQIKSFDEDERLAKLVQKTKPDIVILNLGSNNVLNPNPEVLAANVRSIVKKMQPAACYWLGPPLPIKAVKQDKGVRRVIAENIAPCKFFDTSRLVLDRQTDHIHPTDRGGEVWADAVMHFIFDDEPSHQVEEPKPAHAKR